MANVTKPMALDETLQDTNTALSGQNLKLEGIITKLQGIIAALAGNNPIIGDTDISSIADGTVTGAIDEINTTLEELSISDLSDTNISNPSDGEVIKYDATNQKWVNGSSGSGHNYSTTEHVIGTWIDGKPLYEKAIALNSLVLNNWDNVTHGISNIDTLCRCEATYYRDTGTQTVPMPFYESTSYYAICLADKTYIAYFIKGYGSGKIIAILQYTKTTDV